MGCCLAQAEPPQQPYQPSGGDVPLQTREPQQAAPKSYKLLLLGSGESGKSTFYKRMLLKYGPGFDDQHRMDYKESICENTIESMKTLVHQSRNMDAKTNCTMGEVSRDAADALMSVEDDGELTPDIANMVAALWSDQGIRNTFEYRSTFQVPDSASYFFDRVREIASSQYVPSEEDVLRCRDRTTGINSEKIEIRHNRVNAKFDIFDVGGQRSERRHWVNVFREVKAVLFVVAISEYDQLCFEDDATNRLDEALKVFSMVANSNHFEHTPIVLLFNKIDLFQVKIQNRVPFKFESYNGPQGDYNSITAHIQEVFEAKNSIADRIITEFVCAIQQDLDMVSIFERVVKFHQNHGT